MNATFPTFMPWMTTPGQVQEQWMDFARKMAHWPKALEVARKVRVEIGRAHV